MASYHLPLESSSPKLISQSNNEKNVRQKEKKKKRKMSGKSQLKENLQNT